MKPLNNLEIDALILEATPALGAEAQDISGDLEAMVLKLWLKGLGYLVFQIKGGVPLFFYTEEKTQIAKPLFKKIDKKPFFLFYKTHFKNSKLVSIERPKKYGRMVEFRFESETKKSLVLEFRLFPGGVNLALKADEKSVYLKKPQALTELAEDYKPLSVRSPEVIKDEWLTNQKIELNPLKSSKINPLAKKETAQKKIEEALQFLKTEPHKKFSELLQLNQDLPKKLQPLYRDKLNLHENIEWGFLQHKDNKLKIKRLEERLDHLKDLSFDHHNKSIDLAKNKVEFKATRHLQLSKDVRAFCGKTAEENLGLLRKSKSWHLWMHLKDYPSGHLILSYPKTYKVTEEDLYKSAIFLFKIAAPKKLHAAQKVSFEVIFTETKFVKPIKSAKKGLVQPSRTKSRLFLWIKSENLKF